MKEDFTQRHKEFDVKRDICKCCKIQNVRVKILYINIKNIFKTTFNLKSSDLKFCHEKLN